MAVVSSISLNQNKITAALFNMIISQQVFDSKVASTELADRFRVDGTLYGDSKLYYSFDIGSPEDWLDDSEAPDLLKLNRNKSGKIQRITMGVYKMIYITTDQYLSKQAFAKEGVFADYTAFLTGSLRKIKKVYDRSLINSMIGTLSPSTTRCDVTITTPLGSTTEETNRLAAQKIAADIAVLKAELEDNNRDFNYFNFLRSYNPEDFIAVWNVEQHVKITKLDLPTIFHKDFGADGGFKQYDLPSKWFGSKGTDTLDISLLNSGSSTYRISQNGWYDVVTNTAVTPVSKPTSNSVFLWAGDKVPYTGQTFVDTVRGTTVTVTSTTLAADYYYINDSTIAFMLIHKDALPFMSGFNVGTEFWNPRALVTTNYLIFGHNNLEYLEEYPRIRVKVVQAQS